MPPRQRSESLDSEGRPRKRQKTGGRPDDNGNGAPLHGEHPESFLDPALFGLFEEYNDAYNFDPNFPPFDPSAPAPEGFDPNFPPYDPSAQNFDPDFPPYDPNAPVPENFDPNLPPYDPNVPAPEYPSPERATLGYQFNQFPPSVQPAPNPPLNLPIRPAPDAAPEPAPTTAPARPPRRRRKQLPRYNPYVNRADSDPPRQNNDPGAVRITQLPSETAADFAARVERQRAISAKQRARRARDRERSIRRGSPEQREREREEIRAGLRPRLSQAAMRHEVARLNAAITAETRDWDEKHRACRACLTGRTFAGKCHGGMPCTECRVRGHEGCERLEKVAWVKRKRTPEEWQPKGQKCRQCVSRGGHCIRVDGSEEGDPCEFCSWKGMKCVWEPLRPQKCKKCGKLHKCDNCRRIWTKCDAEIPCFVCVRKGIPCTGLFEDGRCPTGDDPAPAPVAAATAPTPTDTTVSATEGEPRGTKTGGLGGRPRRRKVAIPDPEPQPRTDLPRGPEPDENGVIPCSRCLFAGYGHARVCDDASPCWECELRGITNPEDCRSTAPCMSCALNGMPCDLDRPCARCRYLRIKATMCRMNDGRQFNPGHRDHIIWPDTTPHTAAQWMLPNLPAGDKRCAFCIVNGIENCNPHMTPCQACQEHGRTKERCRWHNRCARCRQFNLPCDIDSPCTSCTALDLTERRICMQGGDRSRSDVANPELREDIPHQQSQAGYSNPLDFGDWPMDYGTGEEFMYDIDMQHPPDTETQQNDQSPPPIAGDPPPTPPHVHEAFLRYRIRAVSTTGEFMRERPGEITLDGHFEPRDDSDSYFGADLADCGCEEVYGLGGKCNKKPTIECDGTDQHEHEEGETHLLCGDCRNKADQITADIVDELHAMKDLRCCRACAEDVYMDVLLEPELASELVCACTRKIGGWLCYSCKDSAVKEVRRRAQRTRDLLKNPQGEGTLCVQCRAKPAMSEEMAQKQDSRGLWRCGSCWKWIVKL